MLSSGGSHNANGLGCSSQSIKDMIVANITTQLKEALVKKMKGLVKEVDGLKEEVDRLTKQVGGLKDEISGLKQEVAALKRGKGENFY